MSKKTEDLMTVEVIDDYGCEIKIHLWRETMDRIRNIGKILNINIDTYITNEQEKRI